MPSLLEILRDPNYVNANPATKQAIFERWAPQDQNYTSANEATQQAIRQRFGLGAPVVEEAPAKKSTIGSELVRGAKQLGSTIQTGAEAVFGSPEEAAAAGLERGKKISEEAGEGVSFEALKKVYEKEGLLSAAGEALGQIPRAVAGQVPQLAAMAAGAKAGAMAGTAVAPGAGTVVGGILGAGATLLPQFLGSNVERQAQEQMERGEAPKIDLAKAGVAAAGQAAFEGAGTAFVLGKRVVKGVLGIADDAALATTKARQEMVKAAERSLAGAAGRGAVRGAAEIPVEVAQQVIERAQAGLDVTSPDALKEYGEAAYQAALVGGAMGGVSGPVDTAFARQAVKRDQEAVAAEQQRVAEQERVAEEERMRPVREAEARVPAEEPIGDSLAKLRTSALAGGETKAGGELAALLRARREEREAAAEVPLGEDYAFLQREKQRLMAEEPTKENRAQLKRIEDQLLSILRRDIEWSPGGPEAKRASVFGEKDLPRMERREDLDKPVFEPFPSARTAGRESLLGAAPAGGGLGQMLTARREAEAAKAEVPLSQDYAFLTREKTRLSAEPKTPENIAAIQRLEEEIRRLDQQAIERQRRDAEAAKTSVFAQEQLPPVESRGAVVAERDLQEMQAKEGEPELTDFELQQAKKTARMAGRPAPLTEEDLALKEKQKELMALEAERNRIKTGGNLYKMLEGQLDPSDVSDISKDIKKLYGKGYRPLAKEQGQGTFISELVSDGILNDFLPPNKRPDASGFDVQESTELIKDKLRNKDTRSYAATLQGKELDTKIEQLRTEVEGPARVQAEIAEIEPGEAAAIERTAGDAEVLENLRYQRAETKGKGLGKDRVQSIVDAIKSMWKNAPEVVVAENMDDPAIPAEVREHNKAAMSKGAKGSPRGFFYKGKAYILADVATSPTQVMETLFHEALGHFGLRGTFGPEMEAVLKDVVKNRRADVEAKAKQYGLDPNNESDMLEAAEEVLAEIAQTKPGLSFVKRAIAVIRNFLRNLGLPFEMSNDDIIQKYILPARAFVEKGGSKAVEGKPAAAREVEIPSFFEDIPNEKWLQDKIDYAQRSPRNEFGVPKMSSVTGRFREPVMIPARWFKDVKGQRGEEKNVRQKDLEAIRKIIRDTGKFPLNEDGTEYVPYVEIGYDGKPWISEGNHRIMAAIAEGMEYIPVELRYFDGGQRRAGVWGPGNVASITERVAQEKPAAMREGRVPQTETEAFKNWSKGLPVYESVEDAASDRGVFRLYHATPKSFVEFKPGGERPTDSGPAIWLASSPDSTAATFRVGSEKHGWKEGANIMPLYVRIERPLVLDSKDMMDWARKVYGSSEFPQLISQKTIDDLIADGYDSIISKGEPLGWGKNNDEFIVFDPKQIKSATGNIGTFDPENADIRYQREKRKPQTETEAFKRWFGDSKIVNPDGSPKVMYHGTMRDFLSFDPEAVPASEATGAKAIYLSPDPEFSSEFAEGTGGQVMPVYVKAENPFDYENPEHIKALEQYEKDNRYTDRDIRTAIGGVKLGDWESIEYRKVQAAIKAMGHDGFFVKERGEKNLGVYKPTQVKSAIGNIGTFDPKNADIRYQREGEPEERVKEPKRNILGHPVLGSWTMPTDTKLAGTEFGKDDLIYSLQDKQIDIKRVVQNITNTAGRIAAKWNPYLQEELYHGRTARATKEFLQDELRPLIQEIQKNGMTIEELETYLHNRHAEAYNKHVAKVNPNNPKMQDGGSGIKTADARKYLDSLSPEKRKAYESLAKKVDAITKGTRKIVVESGLEGYDTIAAWEKAFPEYVPLMREESDDFDYTTPAFGVGSGYDVRGKFSRAAMGSERKVANILANIAMQREKAIIKSNKNRVAQAVFGLAVQNPNPDFWLAVNPAAEEVPDIALDELRAMGIDEDAINFLMKEPRQRAVDPKKNEVVNRINATLRKSDNVLAMRINGEDRYVFFNQNDERAKRAAQALKNLDADQLGPILGIVSNVTRWMASVNTQYNPIFGAYNFLRDVQGAALQLSDTPLRGMQKEVLSGVLPSLKAIYSSVRKERKGVKADTEMAKLWEEFQEEGGQTGFRDQFSRSQERAEALQKEFKQISEGKVKAAGRAMVDWLSDYNDSMENATRLSAYKVAKEKFIKEGMSEAEAKQEAASLAKNLTVNFNRKGQIATQAGALYAFFNAAVQGTTRLAQTLRGPTGKKIIAGGLLLGAMQAALLAAAGFDEEEPPEFVRERNIIIPTGKDTYVAFPMPLGYHVIPGFSRIITEWALSGFKDTPDRIASLTGMFLEAFNPIGNAGWSVQTLAPTFADPMVALAENKDWTGKPIARKDFSNLDPTPGYTRARDTASEFSTQLAKFLNYASGGTEFRPGVLSPTPDQIDYLIGQALGGLGREATKLEQTLMKTATGEELPPYKIPLLGRFYGETKSSAAESNRFYKNLTLLNEHENEIKGRRENKEPVADYLKEHPEARLAPMARATYKDIQALRKRREKLVERDAPRESVKAVEEQIKRKMQLFNERVAKLKD